MEISKILFADVLDIIFDGRYKDYGAYELRRSYNKRITYALIGTFVICLLLVIGSALANSSKKKVHPVWVQEVSLENLKTEDRKPDIPPPPPPPVKVEIPKVEISKYTPIEIVHDNEVKPEDEIKEIKSLDNVRIGDINREGTTDEGFVAPVVESKGTSVALRLPEEKPDYEGIFNVVQIPAQFPGGLPAWSRYLERNLNSTLPVENGAPPGKYTVFVTFIVDKSGNISEVKAENDPGYGTKEEAIRVIQKGPAWTPAIQNGRKVIYRHKQGITFQVQEGE
jgi:protein TonB